MKKKFTLVLLTLLVIFVLYIMLFNMKPVTLALNENIEYTTEGFVDSMSLSNKDKLVAQNQDFELYIDETNSHFRLKNKNTNVVWYSNPNEDDPWVSDPTKTITKSAKEKQKATLELSYFDERGSLAKINNYAMSIYHPESVLFDEGLRTYSIKYVDNGFQVLYDIEDVDVDYLHFPKYLKPEIIESHPKGSDMEQLAYKKYDKDLDVYYIPDGVYEDLSLRVRQELYKIFYGPGTLEYTREQAIAENASYGYREEYDPISFQIAIQVTLTDTGIDMSVIKDSIVESQQAKLSSVSLFPHFGTAVSKVIKDGDTEYTETEGYIVLPDGSGAVLEFNNGKYYQQPYSKRLYGEDLGILSHEMVEAQQQISIPVYGMVKEDGGFAAIITKGDTMATINADVSGRIDSYNKVYPSFSFREHEAVTLGSGYNQYGLDLWTEERVDTDFTVSYTFLDQEEADYVNIARVYREYLESQYTFENQDSTTETVLTVELLGAFDSKSFFLGVPYYHSESLTTFEQSQEILQELINKGITNINVNYKGMMNGGLSTTINNKYKIERTLGGKRGYNDLLEFAELNNIEIYPSTRIMTANDFDKIFDSYRYTSSRIDGSLSMLFTYHLPSKLPYSESPGTMSFKDDYIINPLYLEEIMSDFLKAYDGDNISFDFLGNSLGGSYGDNLVYKQNSKEIMKDVLGMVDQNLMLSNPLGFAMPYAEYVMDLPLETTLYAILDYQIPLLQLVLSGKVDYSTVSLNMANERTVQYNFLKAIETGSNIKYTLSYDNSRELRETEFNYYISTQYTNWLDRIEEQVKEIDEIGIHGGYLVGHEQIANNVYKVTYSNGVVVLINYNLTAVSDGISYNIPAMDYLVLEVD